MKKKLTTAFELTTPPSPRTFHTTSAKLVNVKMYKKPHRCSEQIETSFFSNLERHEVTRDLDRVQALAEEPLRLELLGLAPEFRVSVEFPVQHHDHASGRQPEVAQGCPARRAVRNTEGYDREQSLDFENERLQDIRSCLNYSYHKK